MISVGDKTSGTINTAVVCYLYDWRECYISVSCVKNQDMVFSRPSFQTPSKLSSGKIGKRMDHRRKARKEGIYGLHEHSSITQEMFLVCKTPSPQRSIASTCSIQKNGFVKLSSYLLRSLVKTVETNMYFA